MTPDSQSVDIFRDTPVRYLGYANEVGESFRAIVDKKLVILSYAISSGYVLADTASKGWKAWRNPDDPDRTFKAVTTTLDVLLWQSFASVIIPGFTINRICAGTRWIVRKNRKTLPPQIAKNIKWVGVFVGLASIPFIIHPIDRAVDRFMDSFVRPFYKSSCQK